MWNEPWLDPGEGFGPIPLAATKRPKAITRKKLQAVALGIKPNKATGLDGCSIPELRALRPDHWDELAAILRRCEY
eukprot:12900804-Heterocapsa_arctica.AAC.1